MAAQSPLAVLHLLGDRIALLPPILLDPISHDLLLSGDPMDGNDVLAHYTEQHLVRQDSSACWGILAYVPKP